MKVSARVLISDAALRHAGHDLKKCAEEDVLHKVYDEARRLRHGLTKPRVRWLTANDLRLMGHNVEADLLAEMGARYCTASARTIVSEVVDN